MKKIPARYGNIQVMCFVSIILLLTATSGYLIFENQQLEKELGEVTHEADILNAEVPDPVLKYAPLLVGSDDPNIKELAQSLGSPEKMYLFVRDEVEYSEKYDKRRTAAEVLESRQGDCLGQADLLASLLLGYGYTGE
ncbi:MAG: transglutaminase-like domain-containing protein, partial [Candidatus Methanoperedens sp.]|nr:transglutaminase-like domain-containing protein [Candidatus Methanoperedens sp.]